MNCRSFQNTLFFIYKLNNPKGWLNLKSEWGQSRTPALINKDGDIGRKRPEKMKKGMRNREKEQCGDEQQKDEEEAPHPRKRRKEGEGYEETRQEAP